VQVSFSNPVAVFFQGFGLTPRRLSLLLVDYPRDQSDGRRPHLRVADQDPGQVRGGAHDLLKRALDAANDPPLGLGDRLLRKVFMVMLDTWPGFRGHRSGTWLHPVSLDHGVKSV
jgi:hypothetical protein